jgi:predicted 3-demethylubiquinone-9 3-methyltransferase (glyoxalase superfamily)
MKKSIYTCLWFKNEAKQAAKFYCSIFKNSKIIQETYAGVKFKLDGKLFMALNNNYQFGFNESVSLVIECDTQEEIDYYWNKLSKGGKKLIGGWVKDKYGVSWQIAPNFLFKIFEDPEKLFKLYKVFGKMKKPVISKLKGNVR